MELTPRRLVGLIKSVTPIGPFATHRVQHLQALACKTGIVLSNDFVSSALISLYSLLSFVCCARKVLDEMPHPGLVPQTAMIRSYVNARRPLEALEIFRTMISTRLLPDPTALATTLSACYQLNYSLVTKMIHGYIINSGIEIDPFVTTELIRTYGGNGELDMCWCLFHEIHVRTPVMWNAIMHQYAKHGDIEKSHKLFMEMPTRDIISWNTLLSGYYQMDRCREVVALFHEMVNCSHVVPNSLTLSIVLSACARLGALGTGMWLHAYIGRSGMNLDGFLDHCLIDMYSKCGCIEKAIQVFEEIPNRKDLYTWTSIICGLAMHGQSDYALSLFSEMLSLGVVPDDVTMVGVLNACAHGGLADQARKYFSSMEEMYNLTPKIEHYGCMIDVLGRLGLLEEAYNMILGMPMNPNVVVWGTLLSACNVHSNADLGVVVASKLLELDPSDSWARVMLSNIYAKDNHWSHVMRLRKEMKDVGTKKIPGCSLTEVDGEVHEFLAGDSLHPNIDKIIELLQNIDAHIFNVG